MLKITFIQALRRYYKSIDKQLYPDANNTLRLSFGQVQSVSFEDGVTKGPFTTLEGIIQKQTNIQPFDAPEKQIQLIKNKRYGKYYKKSIDSVPVNFIANLDITGGNSGSATLNKHGELVGVAFDGMFETIVSDYKFVKQTRAISVDIRYILWVLEYFDKNYYVLNEI